MACRELYTQTRAPGVEATNPTCVEETKRVYAVLKKKIVATDKLLRKNAELRLRVREKEEEKEREVFSVL